MPMTRSLLVRGMLVGLVAGLLALGFASRFGEPQVDRAIGFEDARAIALGERPAPAPVSRGIQRGIGLATAVGAYGVAVGGIFGLAFAVAWGRIGRFGARSTAALLALAGFVTVELVPFLKYPANPPAVGDPGTIGRRTGLYLAMIVISVLVAAGALWFGRRLAPRFGNWNATLLAVGLFLVLVAIAQIAMPPVDEVPPGFPATVLWRFRLASLGTQAVLWATFGLLFGALTERSLRGCAPLPATAERI
jgi:predicted cobalt transporter CbtA